MPRSEAEVEAVMPQKKSDAPQEAVETESGRPCLTLAELAKAVNLSIPTLRRRVKDGSLPALQLAGRGHKLRFPADTVERLLSPAVPSEPTAPSNSEPAPKRNRQTLKWKRLLESQS